MRKTRYLKIIAVTLFILLILTSISSSNVISENKTVTDDKNYVNHVIMEYLFNQPLLDKISIGETVYDTVAFQDLLGGGNPGEPNLPSKSAKILLPPENKVNEITVVPGEKKFLGSGFYVEPVALPCPLSQMNTASLPTPNEVIYSSDDPFPGKLFNKVGKQIFRGYDILILELFPVEYVPLTGDLFYYKDLTVSVSLVDDEGGMNPLFRDTLEDREEVMYRIDNPDVVDMYPTDGGNFNSLSVDDYDLLVITTEELRDGFEPLKQVHDTDGVLTEIKTLTEIGSNIPDDIRDFIRDEYLSSGISYVLFGGDYDVVPAQDLWVESWPGGYTTFMPSDLYYSCLDGTYNYDGDEFWGEPDDGDEGGDVDLVAEVYVGRAPVGNITEVDHFVNKTLAYKYVDDEYLNDLLMVGEWLGDEGIASYGGNHMDEFISLIPSGEYEYNISTLYDRDWPGFDPDDPGDTGWPKSELVDQINNNTHIINHLGHGNNYHVMKLDEPVIMRSGEIYGECHDVVDNLKNNQFCFIYSQACLSGAFDNKYSNGSILPYDCIAEYFTIKNDHGAFAGIWNARYGWGYSGALNGPSQRYHKQFCKGLFEENITIISKANQYSREEKLHNINGDCMRWCYYQLNLFGDPTLAIKPPWLPEHNIEVESLYTQSHVKTSDTVFVNTTLENNGRNNETNVLVSFRVNDMEIENTTIPFFESKTRENISFLWIPQNPYIYTIKINVTIPGVIEDTYVDNEKSKSVIVGVLNFDTGECFNTIQGSINDNDTIGSHNIIVPVGQYCENIILNKDISLIGRNRDSTVIKGSASANPVIHILDTDFVNITGFTIRDGTCGVYIEFSSNATIIDNNIFDNQKGLRIDAESDHNLIYHNNFNNTQRNAVDDGISNLWDYGYQYDLYSGGGNYWNDYDGGDNYRGQDQKLPHGDGIGDTPYNISDDESIQDRYPLMRPWAPIYVDDDNFIGPWYGTKDHPYQYIQDGINNANSGDIVFVSKGIYYENVVVDKSINLIGEDKNWTFIDGCGIEKVVRITVDGVILTGFTIQNSGEGNIYTIYSGIYVSSDYNIISKNNLQNNYQGIILRDASFNNINENSILSSKSRAISIKYNSSNNSIRDNVITFCHNGNIVSDYSSNNIIYRNTISKCKYGRISLGNSNNNRVSCNIITHNEFDQAIYLYEALDNIITRNIVANNEYGIFLLALCERNIITENTIKNNTYWGIYIDGILGCSNNNAIYYNNFINNSLYHAKDKCNNNWDNGYPYGGNYWDDYTGLDEFSGSNQDIPGSDDIGDTPYEILGTEGNNKDRYPLIEPYQLPPPNSFIRGDANNNGIVQTGDATYILKSLYLPGSPAPSCLDAADINDDGVVTMSDVIYLQKFLYIPGAPEPPEPGPYHCGTDPTPDDLDCMCHPCFDCNS